MTEDGAPAPAKRAEPAERRSRPVAGAPRRRSSPRQFLHEVNVEMRKVAWPTREEVRNYSIIVLIAVVLLTTLVAVLDYVFGTGALWLYDR